VKTIVAGSRTGFGFGDIILGMLQVEWEISEIVSGGARGVDQLGEEWAECQHLPLKIFRAEWDKYGRAAGPLRNLQMLDYAEALVAFWDRESRGTRHIVEEAIKKGRRVVVFCRDKYGSVFPIKHDVFHSVSNR
jgi:hypothetical protein